MLNAYQNNNGRFCKALNSVQYCYYTVPADITPDDQFNLRMDMRISRNEIRYAGRIVKDGSSVTTNNEGINIKALDTSGNELAVGTTDAAGFFSVPVASPAARLEIDAPSYIVEDVNVAGLTPGSDNIVDVMLADNSMMGQCGGAGSNTPACLRAGNASYENPDKRRFSMRYTSANSQSYNNAYQHNNSQDYFYDIDYVMWHYLERTTSSTDAWNMGSAKADINGDHRVDFKDAAFVTQTLGCNETTCGERCLKNLANSASNVQCSVSDISCRNICQLRDGVPRSWRVADINGDNRITQDDMAAMRVCLNQPATGNCAAMDMDNDTNIDMDDVKIVNGLSGKCNQRTCGVRCIVDAMNTSVRLSVDQTTTDGKYSCLMKNGATVTWHSADLDGHGSVDENDLKFAQDYHGYGVEWAAENQKMDINKDGRVDQKDLSLFRQAYNKTVTSCSGCCIIDTARCTVAGQQPFVPSTNPDRARQCCESWYTDPERYITFNDLNLTGTDNNINIYDIATMKPYYMTGWGPNVKPDVKVHTNNGMSRVDWNMDGKVTINDLALMKKGRERCRDLNNLNQIPALCTICDDINSPGHTNCLNLNP